ncbi:MAG TPA: alpha/beta hydrolase [Candidatus Acidoferrales bacterium]|nr:alpha/beta hydrolase [Candidatus Acidoferrales bacterium]
MQIRTRREMLKTAMTIGVGAVGADKLSVSEKIAAFQQPAPSEAAAFFPGFKQGKFQASGATIHYVAGGSGPAVLLLHGYPENHLMWRRVAPELAKNHTVIAADLRGYGDSSKPAGGGDHLAYSKRAMAQDQVELMRGLGFPSFAVVGHDRGGRVAHRMARDHRDAVAKIAVLDIVPTYTLYHTVTREFATAYYHWFFLIQPAPFPETLLGNSVEFYMRRSLGRMVPDLIPEDVYAEYLRTFRDPAAIHASCEDYRAGASIDLDHDAVDLLEKVSCPLLVLWGQNGPMNRLYDVLAVWKELGTNVSGRALPAGHFMAEEKPEAVLDELTKFLAT